MVSDGKWEGVLTSQTGERPNRRPISPTFCVDGMELVEMLAWFASNFHGKLPGAELISQGGMLLREGWRGYAPTAGDSCLFFFLGGKQRSRKAQPGQLFLVPACVGLESLGHLTLVANLGKVNTPLHSCH